MHCGLHARSSSVRPGPSWLSAFVFSYSPSPGAPSPSLLARARQSPLPCLRLSPASQCPQAVPFLRPSLRPSLLPPARRGLFPPGKTPGSLRTWTPTLSAPPAPPAHGSASSRVPRRPGFHSDQQSACTNPGASPRLPLAQEDLSKASGLERRSPAPPPARPRRV